MGSKDTNASKHKEASKIILKHFLHNKADKQPAQLPRFLQGSEHEPLPVLPGGPPNAHLRGEQAPVRQPVHPPNAIHVKDFHLRRAVKDR